MLTRTVSVLPGLRSFGWFMLGWTVLANASTGAFAFSVGGSLSHWLDRHAWVGFLIGFLSLALAVVWPDLKRKLHWIKLPPTLHERVHILDERVSGLFGLQDKVNELTHKAHTSYDEQLGRLAVDRTKAIEEHSNLSLRVRGVEDRIDAAETRLDEHRPWISDLERTLAATRSSLVCIHKELTSFSIFMCDVSTLIAEADLVHYYLTQILFRYPESEAAKAPFSKPWWRPDVSTHPIAFVAEWALLTIRHVEHCRVLAVAFHFGDSVVVDEQLGGHIASWSDSTPFAQCLSTLASQRAKLSALRQDYAANFSEKALSATTS